jgi:hypothetical protein
MCLVYKASIEDALPLIQMKSSLLASNLELERLFGHVYLDPKLTENRAI